MRRIIISSIEIHVRIRTSVGKEGKDWNKCKDDKMSLIQNEFILVTSSINPVKTPLWNDFTTFITSINTNYYHLSPTEDQKTYFIQNIFELSEPENEVGDNIAACRHYLLLLFGLLILSPWIYVIFPITWSVWVYCYSLVKGQKMEKDKITMPSCCDVMNTHSLLASFQFINISVYAQLLMPSICSFQFNTISNPLQWPNSTKNINQGTKKYYIFTIVQTTTIFHVAMFVGQHSLK
uniref:Uncharacterized protein n=1 Tax=Glossina palpalis gambiensis TaxID=67801 RepID=A0A1B0B0B7_9MUSC